MTRKTKQVIFYSAVAVFLVLSYAIILYAQGYKYSFAESKFQRTGAISLKANVGAKVFVDDKLKDSTSFFGNSFSVNRLLPGVYKVSVQKDGYSLWQKRVTVEEGLVTDFPKVYLLPEEGEAEQKLFEEVGLLFEKAELSILPSTSFSIFKSNDLDYVKGFKISENKNKVVWWTANELWITWLNDQHYQPLRKRGRQELITRFSKTIQNAIWFRGEDHLAVEIEERDVRGRPYSSYKIIEIDKRGGINIVEL